MKILCVIDSLGSGGAQRQMVNLACGMKAKGHDVELLVYFPKLVFFRTEIDEAGIKVHEVEKGSGFSWLVVIKIRNLLRTDSYQGVISFLGTPNVYCELAKLLLLFKMKLIVGERSNIIGESGKIKRKLFRCLHFAANYVVANSYTHSKWLRSNSWLLHKTHVIYNGYSIPQIVKKSNHAFHQHEFKYLVVGRINSGKNGIRLIESLIKFYQKNGYVANVKWAGRQENNFESLVVRQKMEDLLLKNPNVAAQWQWLDERDDIPELLQQCDALIHVSLYEGLPNVVCEAFIAGRPVIASNVCDHPILVEDGVRGLLCDPLSPDSICSAIKRFEEISDSERVQLGNNARAYAEEYLTVDRMVSAYEALLTDDL